MVCLSALVPHYENNLFDWDFDVELGNTTELLRDDPGTIPNTKQTRRDSEDLTDVRACVCVCVPAAAVVSCSFDEGLCVWMTDSEGDLKWEIKEDPAGKTNTDHLVDFCNQLLLLFLPVNHSQVGGTCQYLMLRTDGVSKGRGLRCCWLLPQRRGRVATSAFHLNTVSMDTTSALCRCLSERGGVTTHPSGPGLEDTAGDTPTSLFGGVALLM